MAGYTSLLSPKEQAVCTKLSSQSTLQGKRAKALLALDDGDTQTVAAKKTGLTYGQVKYLLTAFRKKGLSVFPEMTETEKKAKAVQKAKSDKSKKPKREKKKKEKRKKLKSKTKKQKEKKSKKKKSKKSKKK